MNRIARQKNERRIKAKREAALNYVKAPLYILGFILALYTLRTYNFTFIKWQTVFLIGVIPALLCAILLKVKLKEYGLALILWGIFFAGAFFIVNSFSGEKPIKIKLNITDRYEGGSRSSPHVTVEYNGIEKDVNVDINATQHFLTARYLLVTVKKGCLGYYHIESRELVMK